MKKDNPIAIIGLGCRFPGNVSSPEQYWEMIVNKTDAICEVPKDRWNYKKFFDENKKKVGKSYARFGGFLKENIYHFDPMFFGISPREAEAMDPQQRYLLQTTYEALEDAGQQLDKLQKTATGVFIGGFTLDNKLTQFNYLNRDKLDANTATSANMTLLANRLSYIFDFNGPSITVDTACSSSLVATHLACQSIWAGECELAIAGGINIMSRPEYSIVMSKGEFLSRHGHCMAFDALADGYTRGEGCGIAILKPLKKALEDEDYIYSTIRNTGVNQDGATKGIALPNGDAQKKLIENVCQQIDLSPADIHVVEAHGTGTQAGDTTETSAINSVMAKTSRQEKCVVGSVKTNIGHLEAGAGIAGLIKASLMVNKAKVLPNIHFKTPNPKIPFAEMDIRIPTEVETWPVNTGTRRASINSFGYGGTNAHAVVESYDNNHHKALNNQFAEKLLILPITAQDDVALGQLCKKYADQINNTKTDTDLYNILYSASTRRTFFKTRLCVIGEDKASLCTQLYNHGEGIVSDHVVLDTSTLNGQDSSLVYVFTGMGPQWFGMGAELYREYPIFRNFVDKADKIFTKISGWSILAEMKKSESSSRMNETQIAQPANFIVQVGIAKLLESYGIKPNVIIGHSVGEVSAAYVSGVLNLEDALLVSHHRSRLQGTLAGSGSMLAVGLSENNVMAHIESAGGVEVAAINSPDSVTLAGETESLIKLESHFNDIGIFNRFLQVEVPYHCAKMEPVHRDFMEALSALPPPKTADIPLYSTVTGKSVDGAEWNSHYWWQNIRQSVRFSDAIENISIHNSNSIFMEIGPHPVLKNAIQETLRHIGQPTLQAQTLNRKADEIISFRKSIAQLFTLSYSLDWKKVNGIEGHYVKLPRYIWSLQEYKRLSEKTTQELFGHEGHVFFNQQVDSPTPVWEVEFSHALFPYVADHKIEGHIVLPGAAYVEVGLAIAHYQLNSKSISLEDLQFHSMLADQETVQTYINTAFDPANGKFKVHSRIMGQDDSWKLHASGKIIDNAAPKPEKLSLDLDHGEEINIDDFYDNLSAIGLEYGKTFRPITCLRKLSTTKIVAKIQKVDNHDDYDTYYLLHPTILDAAFQAMAEGCDRPYVPVSIKKMLINLPLPANFYSLIEITEKTDNAVYSNIALFDEQQNVLVQLQGVKGQQFSQARNNVESLENCFYELKWIEADTIEVEKLNDSNWLVIGDEGQACLCTEFLRQQGLSYHKAVAASVKDIVASLESIPKITNIVYLDNYADDNSFNEEKIINSLSRIKNIIQAVIGKYPQNIVKLLVLTKNSYRVLPSDQPKNLIGASINAFVQLVENEHPNIQFYCVDVDSDKTLKNNMDCIFLSKDVIREHAFRGKSCFRHLLDKSRQLIVTKNKLANLTTYEKPVALRMHEPGDIMSLHFAEVETETLQADQVKIQTIASSLNFKDLLKIYKKIDVSITQNTYYENTLGFEVSGKIIEVGSAVKGFNIGDQVVGLVPDAFRNYANVPARFVTKLPSSLSPYEAPTLIGYMTAYHGLLNLAQLQEGEKVLIHNAAGGVGLIAVQVAQWRKAEVYATAGNDEKRQYLREAGVYHIYDSRNLQFVEAILRDTQGYGVDVVLNAMAGEALIQSFNLLAPYGRFIEIGKKNIADNSDLPMKAFNENLTFASVDIDRILKHKPSLAEQLIHQVCHCFDKGYLKAIPIEIFPADKVVDAFQFMSHSKHIGKVVLDFKDRQLNNVLLSSQKNSKIRREAAYMVTGGTKGFGLEIAKWIAAQGAGQLILVSRSGIDNEYSEKEVRKIVAQGTEVSVIEADVGSEEKMKALISRVKLEMLPLRGVFHAAVILEDNFIAKLTDNSLNKVLRPKLIAALYLHQLTADIPLDIFCCFSSISALLGNKGQAAYVIANAYLDALCQFRRAKCMAGTSINWGAISDVGILSRKTDVAALFERLGLTSISPNEALKVIDQALENEITQIGAFRLDWSKWALSSPSLAHPDTRFKLFLEQGDSNDCEMEKSREIFIANCPENIALRSHILHAILKIISQLLKFPIDKLDGNTSINNMGVDSLVAVELIMLFRQKMGLEISTVDILAGPTPEQLSNKYLQLLPE